jgi:hypothetical protein
MKIILFFLLIIISNMNAQETCKKLQKKLKLAKQKRKEDKGRQRKATTAERKE